jgi:hypothetical protein
MLKAITIHLRAEAIKAVEGEAGAAEDLEYLEREKWLDRAEIQYPQPP